MRRYFGTDGIRGLANQDLTAEVAYRCGNALCALKKFPTVVIGRDTRSSGDMLTLAVGTSFIFHYSILLSDFCSYVSQAGVN